MQDNEPDDKESSERFECPAIGCDYVTDTQRGVRSHFGSHAEEVKEPVYLDEIRRLSNELDRTPSRKDMEDVGEHSLSTYLDMYDTWNTAVEKAGLEPNEATHPGSGSYTDDEILGNLVEFAEELGRTPTANEMSGEGPHSPWIYRDRFGSWNEALEMVGLEINSESDGPGSFTYDRHSTTDTEGLLNGLREFAEELGRTPTCAEMDENGPYHHSHYQRDDDIGSWNDAVKMVGFEPNHTSVRRSNSWLYNRLREFGLDFKWRSVSGYVRVRDGECQMCGHGPDEAQRLIAHHVIPVILGGVSDTDLLITLCDSCHDTAERYTEQHIPMTDVIIEQIAAEEGLELEDVEADAEADQLPLTLYAE